MKGLQNNDNDGIDQMATRIGNWLWAVRVDWTATGRMLRWAELRFMRLHVGKNDLGDSSRPEIRGENVLIRDRIRAIPKKIEGGGMHITIGKLLSLLVALGYAIGLVVASGGIGSGLFVVCGYLLFPLALIWFPEELGSLTGYVGRGGSIDSETPPILVSIIGWLILVGFPVLCYFLDK